MSEVEPTDGNEIETVGIDPLEGDGEQSSPQNDEDGELDQSDDEKSYAFHRDLLRLLPWVRPYWKLAAASASLIGVGSVVSLMGPWPLAIVLDTVLGNKPLPALLGPLGGGLGKYWLLTFAVMLRLFVALAESGVAVVDNYVNTRLSQRVVLDFRSDLFQHVQRLSLSFHDRTGTGRLMFKLNNEADAAGIIVVAIAPLAQAVLTLLLMFLIAFRLDTELALIALGVVPFIYYSASYYTKRIQPRLYEVRNLEGQTLQILHEAMSMVRVIVAFGREPHEYRRFRQQGETAVDARVKLTVRQTLFGLAVSMITSIGTAAVLGVGALHVIDHRITPGELVVMLGYVALMYQPLEQLSNAISTLQQHFIALRYAFTLLDTQPDVEDAPDAIAIERARGEVKFENVSFGYPGRDKALDDVSLAAGTGQRVAVVGPTGAGKTTLVSLIPRFYDPVEGRVLLDGIDIRKLTLRSLREQVSLVQQEPLLFTDSIAENIRYGRLEASDEEVEDAARAANAHDFISRLPRGYATKLGERGATLSGGERQRVAIARAFIRNAPILILDEPTSAVDSKTESVILEALERLMVGRTTFLVAHRLSTIRHADLILVVNGGQIVEKGTHDELLALGGLYKQLHDVQMGSHRARLVAPRAAGNGRDGSPGDSKIPMKAVVLEAKPDIELGDGEADEERRTAALALVRAFSAVLDDGSLEPLRSLAVRQDDASRSVAELAAALVDDLGEAYAPGRRYAATQAWSLLAAARAAENDGSRELLRTLAADPTPEARDAAQIAKTLLADLDSASSSRENAQGVVRPTRVLDAPATASKRTPEPGVKTA